MTRQRRYITRMVVFLVVVTVFLLVIIAPLERAFSANPVLNGLILGVLVIGIIYAFRQVLMLKPELAWIEGFKRQDSASPNAATPRLLAPMATMLAEKQGRFSLSATASRSLLDGIASRLDEARDISRYLIGLLIFLGLLGTFWGLLGTIGAVADTIDGLSVDTTDIAVMFEELKHGLSGPLGGMGTAFSSSLFGLAGSVIMGFLDLQAGQAQNRFYNDLEDWLSGLTRLGSGAALAGADGEASVPAYMSALLEQTADSLDKLERAFSRSEESRNTANDAVLELAGKMAALSDHLRDQHEVLAALAAAQGQPALDEASRDHLRNMDVHLTRLAGEVSDGRDRMVDEIRAEIKLLTRTLAATRGGD